MYGMTEKLVAQDLADNGYYVFVASYRLAPCGQIEGQPCHINDATTGRPPQQTNGVKAEIRAIRADSRFNGKIGVVGGSGGGSHALFSVLDTSTSSTWNPSLRPDCAVGLSGAYDLSDRTPEDYGPHHDSPVGTFAYDATNYVNDISLTTQKMKSPIWLVFTPTQTLDFKPVMLINSRYDPMPYHQPYALACAFQAHSIDPSLYTVITVPDAIDHAFALWTDGDGGYPTTKLISTRVIEFLDAHLK